MIDQDKRPEQTVSAPVFCLQEKGIADHTSPGRLIKEIPRAPSIETSL